MLSYMWCSRQVASDDVCLLYKSALCVCLKKQRGTTLVSLEALQIMSELGSLCQERMQPLVNNKDILTH
jgi:hypothetical protein